jgi:hypothetical protein
MLRWMMTYENAEKGLRKNCQILKIYNYPQTLESKSQCKSKMAKICLYLFGQSNIGYKLKIE